MIAVLAGCVQPTLLVDDGWGPATADPVPEHAPTDADCAFGWWVEEGLLEVDTGLCGYLTVGQPIGHPLNAGDVLTATLVHDALVAPEPAEAHVAVGLDGRLLWEATVAIPSSATVRGLELVVDERTPAGAELTLHLHNHGANNWRMTLPALAP
jgi:hypothetical protein